MVIVFFVTLPCGILGQVWNLTVPFPELCRLFYFVLNDKFIIFDNLRVDLVFWLNNDYYLLDVWN